MPQPPAAENNQHSLSHTFSRNQEARSIFRRWCGSGSLMRVQWSCWLQLYFLKTWLRLKDLLKKKKKKCIWYTILCSFLEYYIVIQHLHTLGDDHNKSSNHLSPYKGMMILLTIFLVLYIRSWWFIYFDTGNLYPYIPFIYFTQSVATPLSPSNHSIILCIYESVEGSASKLTHRKVAEDRHGFSQSEGSQRQSEQGGGKRRGGEYLLE